MIYKILIHTKQTHATAFENRKNQKGHLFFIAVQTVSFDNPEMKNEHKTHNSLNMYRKRASINTTKTDLYFFFNFLPLGIFLPE